MLIYSEQHDANPAHCACDSKTVRAAETVGKLFRSAKRASFYIHLWYIAKIKKIVVNVCLICVPVAAINISEQNYLRYHKSQLYSIYQHQQNESAHSNRFKMLHNKVQFKSFHSFFLFHFVPEIAKTKK